MKPTLPQVMVLVAVVIGVAVIYSAADRMYLTPRAELRSQLEQATTAVDNFRRGLDRRPELQQRMQQFVDRTLGGDIETVDHRLRTRLNRLAEQLELNSISVTTSSPRALGSPARSRFRGVAVRHLRDELDFVEVPGSVAAEGTLTQVIELIDRIEAEPWLKHVHDVTIDPRDNGSRFTVRVRLRTLFMPGHRPETEPEAPYDRQRLTRLASVMDENPFRLPPPRAPEPEQRPAQPRQPAAYPYDQWILTGVAEGSHGPEAWLTNRRSGESRRIESGETLQDIVLVSTRGEHAEFRQGEERFLVAIGSNLNDRQPLNR